MRLDIPAAGLGGFFDEMFGKPAATTAPATAPTVATAAIPAAKPTIAEQFVNLLPGIAQTVLSVKQQNQLNKINVARAQAGQAPLDIAQYQEASAPVIKVQGGVDSGTSGRLAWGIGGGLLLLGLILTNRSKGAK